MRLLFMFFYAGTLLIFNSCYVRHVIKEPTHKIYFRPQSPGSEYTWIDGGWYWSTHSDSYIQTNGTWEKKREGHYYQQGYWKKGKQGYHWIQGFYKH